MKKHFILTSVLTLAACGGGSGGTGTGMTDYERAALSNKNITGMVSRIQSGDSYNNLSRSATNSRASRTGGIVNDTVYLDDVLFESADKEYGAADEDFSMRFHVEPNGRIDGIISVDDGEEQTWTRNGEDNKFNLAPDPENENIGIKPELIGSGLGLKYSDFGYVKVYQNANPDNYMFIVPIAGGYEVKNITDTMSAEDLETDIVFNGVAVANVGEPDTTVAGERLTLRDNNASLTFDKNTGNEILSANFVGYTDSDIEYSDWYNVVATRYADGDAEIAFETPTGRTIPVGFEATNSGKVENNNIDNQLSVGFNYYGDGPNNPNEATGIIHYQCEGCKPLLMGFGGKAQ